MSDLTEIDYRQPLADRGVLITGAGGGVGRGLALACARAGAAVALGVRRVETGGPVLEEIKRHGGRALTVRCDVTDPGQVEAAVAETVDAFGSLGAVVHNASSGRSSAAVSFEDDDLDSLLDQASVGLTGAYHLALAAHAHLAEVRGSFVVLTSRAGILGNVSRPFYATVKAGQRGFVKSLALEWAPQGIRVNALAPLATSPAMDRTFEESPGRAAARRASVPLGWIGDPELDIGPAGVFLCSDASRYVTGQTLCVNGGEVTSL